MYLSVQIIQCVLYYFCFVNSFRNSTEVNGIYWKTLEWHEGSLVGRKCNSHDRFNDMPELTWISTCKYVTKELRNNEGYVDVYVDYRVTSRYTGKRCSEILVWVPRVSKNVKQVACYCFIRSSILALDIPYEYNQYNRKIMIYPLSTDRLMVFEENKDQGNFYPLEIYDNKRWLAYTPADVKITKTALPQSYGEVSNLKTILDPIFHDLKLHRQIHLNKLRRKNACFSLCQIVLQRTRYFGNIIFSPNDDVPEKQRVIVILRIRNVEPKVTMTLAYDCSRFIPNSETIFMNYKIAPGPKQDSVLVLRETNCPRDDKFYSLTSKLMCFEIVELIEHLSVQYISIYY